MLAIDDNIANIWMYQTNMIYTMLWLIGKNPNARRDWGQEEKGMTEDEMVRWQHWLDGHGFE